VSIEIACSDGQMEHTQIEEPMLEKVKDLKGFKLEAIDGHIGTLAEFYFDDRHWTVRYLVADTGSWLSERQVLISPLAVASVNRDERTISVNQTRKQIEDGPAPEAHKPISRQFEDSYHDYYGFPFYWGGTFAVGAYLNVVQAHRQVDRIHKEGESWDYHLRSTKDVTGYVLQAKDGDIGHVEDFILEDVSWTIRYLIVDTRNWWPGRHVLVSPTWIDRIDWVDGKVTVLMTREAVRESPEYTETSLLTRDYETKVHEHYDRPGYWGEDPTGVNHK
jgi:hypothetical protein